MMLNAKKSSKRLLAVLLSLCMLAMLCAPVFAYTFSFGFDPSITNNVRTTEKKPTTSAAYVKRNYSGTATNFVLLRMKGTAPSPSQDIMAADEIKNCTTAVKQTFKYRPGEGTGKSYYMAAYPTYAPKFDAYTVTGTWAP